MKFLLFYVTLTFYLHLLCAETKDPQIGWSITQRKIDKLFRLNLVPEFSIEKIIENINSASEQISIECLEDLFLIDEAMNSNFSSNLPSDFVIDGFLKIIDASGKIPAGLLSGALTFWGYPHECQQIKVQIPNRSREFLGDYSRVAINLAFGDWQNSENCDPLKQPLFLMWDICLPKSCDVDLLTLLRQVVKFDKNGTEISPVCAKESLEDQKTSATYQTYIVSIIMGTILGIGILASVVDFFILAEDNPVRKEKRSQVLMSFSLYRNICEIFSTGSLNKKSTGQIGPIHCIRAFSICWVILAHAYEIDTSFFNNPVDILPIVKDVTSQVIFNSYFSVDSFFFISGVLLSYMWFKQLKTNRSSVMSPQAWVLFYLHRFIRLSPPYFLMIAFYTWVFPLLTIESGNMATFLSPNNQLNFFCRQNWWTHLLYINNLVHPNQQCFGPGWYLASDMQMYIFTPILLIPLAFNKFLGVGIAALVFVASIAANIATVYKHHYPLTSEFLGFRDPKTTDMEQYSPLIYYAAWIRCTIYIMGLLVGYFLQHVKKLKINWMINLALWALSISLMLTVLLGLRNYMNGNEVSLFWRAMYSALSKPAWGLGLTWIIISCYYGYGGPINKFMSWNIWIPLGRLSYCVYLLHIMALISVIGLYQGPLIYSGFIDMLNKMVIPIIFWSFFFAIIWSAAFEIPFSKVEMVLLKSRVTKKQQIEKEYIVDDEKLEQGINKDACK